MIDTQTDSPTISNKTLVLAMLLAGACSYLLPILSVSSPRMTSLHADFAGRSGTFVCLDRIDGLAAERRTDFLRTEALGPGWPDVYVLEIPHNGTRR